MKLLALDTSTLLATVAVTVDGELRALSDRKVTTHSEGLLGLVDETLHSAELRLADVDAIACGVGPGSFTGLRIGLATAKGLAFALDKPLLAVSSLAALALEARPFAHGSLVLALLDARKGEVYAGLYRPAGQLLEAVADEVVLCPDRLEAFAFAQAGGAALQVVGDGATVYPSHAGRLGTIAAGRMTPSAASVARLAATVPEQPGRGALATVAPRYIRLSEAELVAAARRRG